MAIAFDQRLPGGIKRRAGGDHTDANVHHFHLVPFFGEPITAPVEIVKGGQKIRGVRNIQLITLSLIAKVYRAQRKPIQPFRFKFSPAAFFQFNEEFPGGRPPAA